MGGWGRGTGGRRAAAHRWDALFPPDDAPPGLLDLDAPGPEDSGPDEPGAPEPEGGARRRRGPERARLGVSVRLGAVLTVLLAAVCATWWGIAHGAVPAAVPVDAPPAHQASAGRQTPDPEASPSSPAPGEGGPTVHVAGAVSAPGVYHLAPGARVHEAIAAAGGAKAGADLDRLNLAAPVEDGTRLKVPLRGEPEEAQAAGAAAAPAPGAAAPSRGAPHKVDLNAATAEDLGALPRVGPVLAQRIVDYRTAHGRFSAPEDLDAVSGIGPKMLESLLPLVTVG